MDFKEHHGELVAIRHDLHAHPEIAFEETRTSEVIRNELERLGIEVHCGLALTGVVGVIRGRPGRHAIGLRADMDALPIQEDSQLAYRSKVAGKMHGCGHDGHVAMLLGAARWLAKTRDFDGTVYLIFQPAEEGRAGARKMIEEGLFERFPMDAVYAIHNIPGLPAGQIYVLDGPMMASFDLLEICIRGKGGHAAHPHHTVDPILCGSRLVDALQMVVSRRLNPIDSAVVSITTFHAGDTHNVIPQEARLSGTVRTLDFNVRDAVEREIAQICQGIAIAHGAEIDLKYERCYPPTVNHPHEAAIARRAATAMFGADAITAPPAPLMAAEDFAFMLEKCPGAYIWIGNGIGSKGGCSVHHPAYDFNDDILTVGSAYWVSLALAALADVALNK